MPHASEPLRVCLATHNAHKVQELRALLAELAPTQVSRWEWLSLADVGITEAAIEDGASFADNARIKAHHAAVRTGLVSVADDSGLLLDALDGAPGIYSARYGGTPLPGQSQDARNRQVVLQAMAAVPDEKRGARFVCALALCDGRSSARPACCMLGNAQGEVHGRLLPAEQGQGGFGYDPLFVPLPDELSRAGIPLSRVGSSFGELSAAEKNRLSHRTRAVSNLLPALLSLLAASGGSAG